MDRIVDPFLGRSRFMSNVYRRFIKDVNNV